MLIGDFDPSKIETRNQWKTNYGDFYDNIMGYNTKFLLCSRTGGGYHLSTVYLYTGIYRLNADF